ncbi:MULTISPECIES: DUF7282 domain-containing protein [Halorussus]|uniref:DUF7282 domain-containing protein n=1 Tax=Halorussus TaxID=1070314 RepID=UPI00209E7B87|nr:twin-arginine translocation signal domain-containing protein [Halorussus vallis]USZ77738.1 twin-arginine translocation signal domain-containing protein [Halorussus vallis]
MEDHDSNASRTDDTARTSRRRFLGACATTGLLLGTTVPGSGRTAVGGTPATKRVDGRRRSAAAARAEDPAAAESTTTPTDGASVSFTAQTSDGETVTVDSATLPKDGFVAIYETRAGGDAPAERVVGVSEYLPSGTHENVEITLFDVPGADFDRTRLSTDRRLLAVAHQDTDTNRQFEFVSSGGTQDPPFVAGGERVADVACVSVRRC